MNCIPRFALVLAALLCFERPAVPAPQALTSVDDVQACLPLAGGKLLLGTAGGLLLASDGGRSERVWTRLDGLPGTRIHALLREGQTVWIGTDRGLARMDLNDRLPRVVARSAPVRAITRHQGKLVVGTWGDGALQLKGRRLVKLPTPGGADGDPAARMRRRITALASSGRALHVGTAGAGLWRLTSGRKLVRVAANLPSPFVWSLAVAGAEGELHVGTLAGLVKISTRGGHARAELLGPADARALGAVDGSALLVGGYGQGLRRLSLHTGRITSAPGWAAVGAGSFVNAISAADGATCVGTRAGAWVKRGPAAPRRVRPAGPPSNDVSALATHGGRLYVGTFDGGLAALEGGRWQQVRGVDRRIDALAIQRTGATTTLWVGTPRGLFRLRGGSVRRFGTADGLRHQHVHALAVLRDGALLAGTARGVVIVRGDRVEPITVKQGLPVASVWAAIEDREGGLWLGTSRGLYHWSRALRRYTRYSVSGGHLKDDWVTALTLHNGAIYVGTYNAGVSRLTRGADGAWTGAHLGGGWVNFAGLRVLGQTLYAACMSGLYRLSLETKDGAATMARVPLAAPGRDVTAVTPAPQGKLWVASRRGLALR